MSRTCPICEGPIRETVGMVCQTCGRDYGATAGETRDRLAAIWRIHRPFEGRCVECVEWCECPDPDICTHGNVPWPCPTAVAGGFGGVTT